jgi:outer membrane protein assembly factor BamB
MVAPDPVVSEGTILLMTAWSKSADRQSVLLENIGENPKVRWKSQDLWTDLTTPVIIDGYIYSCFGGPDHGSADLRCHELITGKLIWKKKLPEDELTTCVSLMAADGKLIVLNDKGMLFIAEASPSGFKELCSCDVFKGEKKKMYRQFWIPPVLCNGRIYCRNFAGDLICIDVSK